MPAERTLQELVTLARYHSQIVDTGTYSDGIGSVPAGTIPISHFVNLAYRMICKKGFAKTTTDIAIASGTKEYALPPGVGHIERARAVMGTTTVLLRETSLDDLEQRERGYLSADTGIPNVYILSGMAIMLHRTPNAAGTLTLRHSTVPAEMTGGSDIPSSLPYVHHDAIGILAAMMLVASDADDSSAQSRRGYLESLWQLESPDIARVISSRDIFARQESAA